MRVAGVSNQQRQERWGLGLIMWFGLLAVVGFFYERKMSKESGNGHSAMFIVVVMVCV